MFGTAHLKIIWLQKTVEYKTNEHSAKYSISNIQTEIYPGKVSSTCNFCFVLKLALELY